MKWIKLINVLCQKQIRFGTRTKKNVLINNRAAKPPDTVSNVLARYVRIKGNIRTLLEDNLAYAAPSFYCTFLPSCKTCVSGALPNLNL